MTVNDHSLKGEAMTNDLTNLYGENDYYNDWMEWQEFCRQQFERDSLMLLQEATEPKDLFSVLR